MIEIRKAAVKDSSVLGEIHAKSWKAAYKNIVPDSFLDRFTPEKRQKYFEKALTEEREEDFLVFYDNNPVGLICIGKCRDEDQDAGPAKYGAVYLARVLGQGHRCIRFALGIGGAFKPRLRKGDPLGP